MSGEVKPVGKIRDLYGVVRFEWNIRNYSILTKDKTDGFSLTSPSFEIFAATWNLILHPLSIIKDDIWHEYDKKYVSIFLEKNCSNVKELSVYYNLDMKVHGKVLKSFSERVTFKGNCSHGRREFYLYSSMPELQPDDTVTVLLYIYPTTYTMRMLCDLHIMDMITGGLDTLLKNMEDLYLNQQDCDLKIRVKTREFGVHKTILAARSPVFNAILHHDMKEKNTGIVQIEDFEPGIFNDFLLYLYSGRTNGLSWRNVTELYALGDKYGLQCLKKECVLFIGIHLTIDKFCEILDFAVKQEDSELMEAMEHFFVKNVVLICKTKEWKDFMEENSALCNKLFMAYISSKSKKKF